MEQNSGSVRRWLRWDIGLLAAALVLPVVPAFAESPTDSLRTTSQKVLQVLHDEHLQTPERAQERRQQLVSAVGERLSYEEMSKRSLGEQWTKMNTAQRQEFIDLFQMVLVMCRDLVELVLQRSNACFTVDEFKVANSVVVQSSLIDDASTD